MWRSFWRTFGKIFERIGKLYWNVTREWGKQKTFGEQWEHCPWRKAAIKSIKRHYKSYQCQIEVEEKEKGCQMEVEKNGKTASNGSGRKGKTASSGNGKKMKSSRIMIQKSWNGYEGKGTGKTTQA